jgi:hypothetical protein
LILCFSDKKRPGWCIAYGIALEGLLNPVARKFGDRRAAGFDAPIQQDNLQV